MSRSGGVDPIGIEPTTSARPIEPAPSAAFGWTRSGSNRLPPPGQMSRRPAPLFGWTRSGSNRLPPPGQWSRRPAPLSGGPDRDRTDYLRHAMAALYQVSYGPGEIDASRGDPTPCREMSIYLRHTCV